MIRCAYCYISAEEDQPYCKKSPAISKQHNWIEAGSSYIKLWWPEMLQWARKEAFKSFAQALINRLAQGQARYGDPKKVQLYHKRLEMEVQAYMRTGNAEQLYNIANYCVLEMMAPGHPKHHLDTSVDFVTRGKV